MNTDLNAAAADLVVRIDRFLPQTQCMECGEASCRAYAEALAAGRVDIDQCPPGGESTVTALARLLDKSPSSPLSTPSPSTPSPSPLSPSSPPSPSPPSPSPPSPPPSPPLSPSPSPSSPSSPSPSPPSPESPPLRLAFIREADCIGCKLCIAACPVDCIVGAAKLMHTVIARECSGCRLCVPVCPTDCIELRAPPPDYAAGAPSMWPAFSHAQVQKFRQRAHAKRHRDAARQSRREQRAEQRRRDAMRAEIAAAVARVRSRQAQTARRFVSAPDASTTPPSPSTSPSPTPPTSPSPTPSQSQ